MVFILSKIVGLILKPIIWLLILLIRALISREPEKLKRKLFFIFLLLYLLSNPFLVQLICEKYEYKNEKITNNHEVGILLGGFSQSDSFKQAHLTESGDRLMQSLKLLKQRKIKKLLISGGDGNMMSSRPKEALIVINLLKELQIPDSLLLIESESRNTEENAKFSKQILDSMNISNSLVIISSAWHLPRAKLVFDNVFEAPDYYATNPISDFYKKSFWELLVPSAKSFYQMEWLIKEWVGYIYYKFKY